MHDLQVHISALESDLAGLDDEEDTQPALDKVVMNMRKVNQEMSATQHQRDTLSSEIDTRKREISSERTNGVLSR